MKDGEERNDCFKMEKVINSIITRINTYGKLAPSQQIGRRNKHKYSFSIHSFLERIKNSKSVTIIMISMMILLMILITRKKLNPNLKIPMSLPSLAIE